MAAAASLNRVLPEILKAFGGGGESPRITLSYGASGLLRQQIEAGAPVDAVIFAADSMVDRLIKEGLVDPTSRKVVARNQLVLVRRTEGEKPDKEAVGLKFRDLGKLSEGTKLGIGDPSSVPAGQYARRTLEQLQLWTRLHTHLVYGGDATRVLTYARRGEVDAAIVYATDARNRDDVEILDRADWPDAPRPVVVAAVTSLGMGNELIEGFVSFLASPEGQALFREHGFSSP